MKDIKTIINEISKLNLANMYNDDFLLTWEKSDDELVDQIMSRYETTTTFKWHLLRILGY